MSVFEDIKAGLVEAIEFEKGNIKATTTKKIKISGSAEDLDLDKQKIWI